ncbi:hypothetical protein AOT83_03005 [Mycobacteroides sp. H001]|uniref:hypothetical protein n=1 Tax=Mycobacteroides TaxID=670516 RepID=UPI000713C7BA|nr:MULTISPECIES: hypothetical protein [Mycobacteroides]KRQ23773.1 hypothetical protein AOT86_16880 [Mycobacteroides sp. H072]KRQ36710.1 hypothetical protein AOT84_13705 [Mycobacteroides sp. H002]KRQ55099.1 hypothetical protein AOT85_03665 [Mycobacteroides sp. H054]KRQ72396.1 hypothetical protein AOT83_03005 [Mycobacteroides sp. H001]OHU43296.1 hypothetical protein BKG79_05035 [Mycobacteroides chelonae]
MSRRRRDDFDEQSLHLAQMLRSWDVLGVYRGEIIPSDDEEYDDLVAPIRGWLESNAGPEELSARLVDRLASHYGLSSNDDLAELDFTRQIHAWWLRDGR